jgi:hypothetical protein
LLTVMILCHRARCHGTLFRLKQPAHPLLLCPLNNFGYSTRKKANETYPKISLIKKCQRISILCKGIRAGIAYIPFHRDRLQRVDVRNLLSTVRKIDSRETTASCISTKYGRGHEEIQRRPRATAGYRSLRLPHGSGACSRDAARLRRRCTSTATCSDGQHNSRRHI